MIIVQGGNDATEQARSEVDYYQMVGRIMGGDAATQCFARLFVIPGMNHGSGGDGAFAIDYLSAIEKWVAKGVAPAMLMGSHVPGLADDGMAAIKAGLTAPPQGATVTFTRPAFPFPAHARYRGRGDTKDAANFSAVTD